MIQFKQSGICVFESALFKTTSTVIETEETLIIVDPNWLPNEILRIRQYVDVIRGDRKLFLLFTHSDYDHIIGYNAFPEAEVIASQAFIDIPDKSKILKQIRDFDDENYIKRSYPIEFPEVTHIINSDGQQIKSGNATLRFFLAPGHNADGIFTFIEPYGILVAGDYLSDVEFPYIYHSSFDYVESLKKIEELCEEEVKILIPGHGQVCTTNDEMRNRFRDSYQYIETLRYYVSKGEPFPLETLWNQYDFPGVMTRFHQANEELVKKELTNFEI